MNYTDSIGQPMKTVRGIYRLNSNSLQVANEHEYEVVEKYLQKNNFY